MKKILLYFLVCINLFAYLPTTPKMKYIPTLIPVENILYDSTWVMIGNKDTYVFVEKEKNTKMLCARFKKEDTAQYAYGIYSYFKNEQDIVGMIRQADTWYVFSATNIEYKRIEGLLRLLDGQVKAYRTYGG